MVLSPCEAYLMKDYKKRGFLTDGGRGGTE